MVLDVLFQVAHIKIFLVAALDLAVKNFPIFFLFGVNLFMLLEIGRRGELFKASGATKFFIVFMNFLVPVQV